MNKLKVFGELAPWLILYIIIHSYHFAMKEWERYEFWQPMIDNLILLILLIFMIFNSINWNWFSKRILFSIILILLLNIYTQLFGMIHEWYFILYYQPLVVMINVISLSAIIEIAYKLYQLWKNGKIKFY